MKRRSTSSRLHDPEPEISRLILLNKYFETSQISRVHSEYCLMQ
jgi:hypothetical protein